MEGLRLRIIQIIMNLVGNSIKYNKENGKLTSFKYQDIGSGKVLEYDMKAKAWKEISGSITENSIVEGTGE